MSEKKQNEIYNMSLHEVTVIDSDDAVMRVPGGWVYLFPSQDRISVNPVFVPYNNEFELFLAKQG